MPKTTGRWSFYLFCLPFSAQLRPKQQEFLNSGKPKQISEGRLNIKSYSWGTGSRRLLLVHGWQSNTYRWKNLINALDLEEWTVLAFDAPAHGNSSGRISNVLLYEESILSMIQHYGPLDVLIGHSIGGFASAFYLSRNDHQVSKFISLAAPNSAVQFMDYYQELLGLSALSRRVTEDYFESYAGNKVDYFSMSQFCPAIKVPTLIIHDRGDTDTSYESAITMNDLLSDSKLMITEGLGHNLRSKDVIQEVCAFLKG